MPPCFGVINKTSHQHEIAGFCDEGNFILLTGIHLTNRPTKFVGRNFEEILALNEVRAVRSKIAACSSVRSAMHSVNVLKGHNALVGKFLNGKLGVVDGS